MLIGSFIILCNDFLIILFIADNRTAGFTDTAILDSFSARSALSLATNMTTRPLIGISAFACISALAVILLATQTKFFPKKYEIDDLKDITKFSELKFCASIMFRACVIMSSNCFSVSFLFNSNFIIDIIILFLSRYNYIYLIDTTRTRNCIGFRFVRGSQLV